MTEEENFPKILKVLHDNTTIANFKTDADKKSELYKNLNEAVKDRCAKSIMSEL